MLHINNAYYHINIRNLYNYITILTGNLWFFFHNYVCTSVVYLEAATNQGTK